MHQTMQGLLYCKRRLLRRSEGEKFLRDKYRRIHGKELNLDTPSSFTEKLFHRMIMVNRGKHPVFTQLSDKYLVRDYIKSTIGEKYLVKLLWNGRDPRKIPFDSLPKKSIAKVNSGCGGHIVLEEPQDRKDIIDRLSQALKANFYWRNREYQYYTIHRQIIIEEFLDDGSPGGPLDYRFWCFRGRPEVIQVDNKRHSINPFYDTDWNKLTLYYRDDFADCDISKPSSLGKMIEVASALSSEFDFVRVDLYNVFGNVFFGELSFTPVAGRLTFKPDFWDIRLGSKWILKEAPPVTR